MLRESFLRNTFCSALGASISEEQVCFEVTVVIVIYYRKAKKPKVCKHSCRTEANWKHVQTHTHTHIPVWFNIHFLHHNLLSYVYRVLSLNNRCIRKWSISTTVSLWINYNYECVPMCMCMSGRARMLANMYTSLVLVHECADCLRDTGPFLLKGPFTGFSYCLHSQRYNWLPPPPPHLSSISLKSAAVTLKVKSFVNEWLLQPHWKANKRMKHWNQCHWITLTKPQSVLTSFYGSIEQELNRQIIVIYWCKLFHH